MTAQVKQPHVWTKCVLVESHDKLQKSATFSKLEVDQCILPSFDGGKIKIFMILFNVNFTPPIYGDFHSMVTANDSYHM